MLGKPQLITVLMLPATVDLLLFGIWRKLQKHKKSKSAHSSTRILCYCANSKKMGEKTNSKLTWTMALFLVHMILMTCVTLSLHSVHTLRRRRVPWKEKPESVQYNDRRCRGFVYWVSKENTPNPQKCFISVWSHMPLFGLLFTNLEN